MKHNAVATFAFCFSCVVAHGEGGFLGKLKKTVDAVADGAATLNQTQQPGNTLTVGNVAGLKYRSEANELLNRIKVENREASPDELYTIGRGFSYKPDGSPEVSYADMNQSVIPSYYEKAALGGNTDALLFLLKFYGLGYIEVGGIGALGAHKDERRFREICELKVEKFADYKVPAELPQLASQVDITCQEIANIKAQEKADKDARLAEEAKQKEEEKQQVVQRIAREKAREEARVAEEAKQKEEARLVAEAKQKEKKRQEDQLTAQKKAKEDLLADTKRKYPKADMFRSNIKVYKDFESGVSYQWAVAKLEKDGIHFTKDSPSPFYGTSLTFKDGNNEVTLAFASETDVRENPEGVLAMALIVLPSGISHETALEKYKNQYPGATIKRETEKKTVDNEPTVFDKGGMLYQKLALIITKDRIRNENVNIEIISQAGVGKFFYAETIGSPMKLLFELLPDGSYKKGADLSPELEQAVPTLVAQLKAMAPQLGAVNILLTDIEIEKVFTHFKNSAVANEQKKAAAEKRKSDAAALNF